MTHVLVYESEPPLFCLLRTGKFRQSSGVALGEDGRCRGAHLQTGGHTPPVFRRRAPVRTPLAVGVLPFLHVVFGFEPGEEAPTIPSGVVVFRTAMAGLRGMSPQRCARSMRRLCQSSVYARQGACKSNEDCLTFA